jgi:hypothetical protein
MAAENNPETQPRAQKGRPSTFTDALADEICERLGEGEPLAVICRDEHMPAVRTVSHWKEKHPQFSADFARARDEGFDAIAVDCLNIADDNGKDVRYTDKGEETVNTDVIQRAKLRVETRLKLLAKWDPKRYGEKIAIDQTTRAEPVSAEQMAAEIQQSPVLRREIEAMLGRSESSVEQS